MNITNAQYQSLKTDDVVVEAQHVIIATIDGVTMFVPLDTATATTTKSCDRSLPVT